MRIRLGTTTAMWPGWRPAIRADVAGLLSAQVRRAEPDHPVWRELLQERLALIEAAVADRRHRPAAWRKHSDIPDSLRIHCGL